MPIEFRIAAQQTERLSSLPYFSAIPESGKMELITAMAEEARSDDEARLAISALLADTGRAGNVETNRVPSPGELRLWLQSQRSDKYDTPDYIRGDGRYCERCTNGRPQGWIYEKRMIRGLIYDFSGRCRCQPGGWV